VIFVGGMCVCVCVCVRACVCVGGGYAGGKEDTGNFGWLSIVVVVAGELSGQRSLELGVERVQYR